MSNNSLNEVIFSNSIFPFYTFLFAPLSSGQTVANYVIMNFSVTWLKDGKAIPETSSRYHFSSDGNTSFEFGIKTCTASDVGQYLARAIGQKGETNSAFALNVVNPGEL